jgi:hypothetical protein
MPSPKMAVLAYAVALGFILAVAFHTPAKFAVASGASAPTPAANAR